MSTPSLPRPTVPKLSFPPPKASPPPASAVPPAIIAGVVAALVGAAIWTGVVIISGGWEVGWVAWGIGALVGAVMAKATPDRSVKLAAMAAVIAAGGLAVGKIATFRIAMPKIAQDMLVEDETMLTQAFMLEMRDGERYSAEVSLQLAAMRSGDTLSDAIALRMMEEAQQRMGKAPPEERKRVAQRFADRMLEETGLSTQFSATLSAFDFLWFFLAIATAFKIMRGD